MKAAYVGDHFDTKRIAVALKMAEIIGTWSSARIAIARKICSTRFYYCSTPFEQ